METVVEPPPEMRGETKYREHTEEEPTFVHARPAGGWRRNRRSYRDREPGDTPPPPPSVNAPVGAWTVIETVARWWFWLIIMAILGAAAGWFAGQKFFQTGFVASVEIMRLDPGASMEHYKPRSLTEEGFGNVLKT